MPILDGHAGFLFSNMEEIMSALDDRLFAKVVLWELAEPFRWMLFVVVSNLSIDGGSEYVPFQLEGRLVEEQP